MWPTAPPGAAPIAVWGGVVARIDAASGLTADETVALGDAIADGALVETGEGVAQVEAAGRLWRLERDGRGWRVMRAIPLDPTRGAPEKECIRTRRSKGSPQPAEEGHAMNVYHAVTADGHRFDFCVAPDAELAAAITRWRYRRAAETHFVGDDARTAGELLDGFDIECDPAADPRLALEYARLAEYEAAALAFLDPLTADRIGDSTRAAFERLTGWTR